MNTHIINNKNRWHRAIIFFALCLFVVCIGIAHPQKGSRKEDSRVYLDHADELMKNSSGPHADAQIAKGKVVFRHKGAILTCDSAYYYQESNSFQAFGNVRMRQGDTLTLVSRYANYKGDMDMVEFRKNVVLTHRKTKLECDSLDFDRQYSYAYFFQGGKLTDQGNTLVSDWGEYWSDTRQANFYFSVKLDNKKFLIEGDTLTYDTRTRKSHFVGETKITSKENKSVINSHDGYYNTDTNQAELYGRSTVINDDGKTITADSLYHNSKNGHSEGYGNVVYTDDNNKNRLTAGYFEYDQETGNGYANRDPVVVDYSQGDTLYMHAEKMRIETHNINTDSVYRYVHAYDHVRAYRRDVQAVCDSLVLCSLDSCLTMYKDPVCWNDNRQLLGDKIEVFLADSTIRYAHVIGQALSVEQMNDSIHYNQVASHELKSWFEDGKLRLNQAEKNVSILYYPIDDSDNSLIGMNYTETDTMRMYLSPERKLQRIWMPKHRGTLYPMTRIPTGKDKLPNFAWFDYMRPVSKDDIYEWRPKGEGMQLKKQKRRAAPVQVLSANGVSIETKNIQ